MRVESAYVRKTSNVRTRRLRALTLQAPFSGIRLYPDGRLTACHPMTD